MNCLVMSKNKRRSGARTNNNHNNTLSVNHNNSYNKSSMNKKKKTKNGITSGKPSSSSFASSRVSVSLARLLFLNCHYCKSSSRKTTRVNSKQSLIKTTTPTTPTTITTNASTARRQGAVIKKNPNSAGAVDDHSVPRCRPKPHGLTARKPPPPPSSSYMMMMMNNDGVLNNSRGGGSRIYGEICSIVSTRQRRLSSRQSRRGRGEKLISDDDDEDDLDDDYIEYDYQRFDTEENEMMDYYQPSRQQSKHYSRVVDDDG